MKLFIYIFSQSVNHLHLQKTDIHILEAVVYIIK